MSPDPNNSEISAVIEVVEIEVSQPTDLQVQPERPESGDEVQRETQALIEAIKRRAQAEVQSAGEFTREAYLQAVRQARIAIEEDRLPITQAQLEESMHRIQHEAERNWLVVLSEIESLGVQLADAARLAWKTLAESYMATRKS